MQARGDLVSNAHGGLALGGDARSVLTGEQAIAIVEPPKRERRRKRDASPNPVGDPLFEALRSLRRELAEEAQIPPYMVFPDSVLRAMTAERPASREAMRSISGVGAKKLEAFGDRFLAEIERN